uniref:Uncharacterized protein n=1 Tax=Arundo donax TaxID=35708 RepID=A0A0A9C6P0_ARUDO
MNIISIFFYMETFLLVHICVELSMKASQE